MLRGSHLLSSVRGCLAWCVACMVAGASTPALGAEGKDCNAIASETLRPGSEGRAHLNTGDRLELKLRAEPGAYSVVQIAEGSNVPRVLKPDESGAKFSFVAQASGDVRFWFKTSAIDGSARLLVRCTLGRESRRSLASQLLAAKQRQVLVEPSDPKPLGDLGVGSEDALWPSLLEKGNRTSANIASSSALHWEDSRSSSIGEDAKGPVKLAAKYKPQPAIMLGVLAQFDQPDDKSPAASGRLDQNWLAGPVTSVQLVPGTTLDARAAWGIVDGGAAGNANSADRRLVDAKLSSTQTFGAWRFSPSVAMNLEETRLGAGGHEGQAAISTTAGRVNARPELAYRFDMGQSLFIEPKAAIGGVWNLDSASLTGAATSHGAMRLKADTGLTIGTNNGTKLELGAGVEESAVNGPNVWSGRLQLSVPVK
jgi:hypothetical protein